MRTLFATCLVLLMLGGCNEKQNASKERINEANLAQQIQLTLLKYKHEIEIALGIGAQQALILDKKNKHETKQDKRDKAHELSITNRRYAFFTVVFQLACLAGVIGFVVYQIRLLLARGLDVYETKVRLQYRSAQNNNPVFEGTARVITSKSLLIQ